MLRTRQCEITEKCENTIFASFTINLGTLKIDCTKFSTKAAEVHVYLSVISVIGRLTGTR